MRKSKTIILFVAIAMLFSFSACGKSGNTESSDTTTVSSTAASTTAYITITTTQPITVPITDSTTAQTTVDPLSVFNNAVAISVPVRATYNRTAVTGKFESGNDKCDSFLNGFIGEETLTPQNGTGLSADISTLTAMTPDCFTSSDITENATASYLTFNLSNIQVPSNDKPPKGGYVFYMDGSEAMSAIQKANEQVVMKNEGTISLSDGILTATVDKSTGKFISIKLQFKEVYQDNIDMSKYNIPSIMASMIPDSISGTFEYDLTVNYIF